MERRNKSVRKWLLSFVLSLGMAAQGQADTITQRIFLIGDGGELVGEKTHPVIDWVKKNVNWNDEHNTAIFLGDNIYPLGLPQRGEEDYERSKHVLDYELSPFLNKKGKAYFVMGNHDWENGKLGGWQRARNQYNYINGLGMPNIKALPGGGCPGPVYEELNNQIVVVFIDSQWFLYVHDKPGPGSTCDARTVEEFGTVLKDIADSHPNQLLLIVTHHPLYSFGVHGGDYTWKEHLFPLTAINKNLWVPLPVLGSIYPITRGVFGNLQDVKHPLYQVMANTIKDAVKNHPNVICVAGHDHSLQFIQRDSIHYLISGSASNLSRVKDNREGKLLFHDLNYGLAMIEVRKSGKVTTMFYNVNSKDLSDTTYSKIMKPVYAIPTVVSKDTVPNFPDSVSFAANAKLRSSFFRNLFIGKNYRQEWSTPVKAPVLDLSNYTPKKQGGGKQTRSLRIEDKDGKEWSLRSVEKFPDAAIPPDLRQTFVKDVVADGISASYPFAGLSIEPFAKAAGVPYLRRKLVYIPDDPRLGRFKATFKNMLAVLEERQPDTTKKTDNTDEIILKLAKDNDRHVDQIAVLKARLLDNFYMDLDRHEGQWEWGSRDTGKGKVYYPIPKDQDQAFFINQGILPFFVKAPGFAPELQGFRSKAANIETFNKPARNFDRFFLNELSKETWSRYVDTLLSQMTDAVIEQAMARQPKEIRGFHAAEIEKKLKKRRQYYKADMMKYYAFLAKEVNIVGTNQRELFVLDKLPGNQLRVTVNKIDKNNNVGTKIYERLFDGKETKELRIYGLEDRDSFLVRGGASTILVRLIGGPGDDYFENGSTGGHRIRVYDVSGYEDTRFAGNESGFIKRISPDPRNNEFNMLYYKYGYFKPSLSYAYNVDDGLFLGLKGEAVTQGFRKEPYSTRHVLRAAHALRTSSYFFGYEGDFTKAVGINDLLIRGDLRAPVNVTNFFGIGDGTKFDETTSDERFYRTRYNVANLSVLLRKQLQSWMRVNYGLAFQYFDINRSDNAGKFLTSVPITGIDTTNLYKPKFYAGPQLLLDINSRNSANVPTRGFQLDAGIKSMVGLNGESKRLTQVHWDMNVVASFNPDPVLVYAERLGAAHNFGDYEIPQAQYLSGTENLRGFRRNRFAGRTVLFNNFELRLRLVEFNTFLFPGSLGLLAFHDVGRVWADGDNSNHWHHGYGGGIWVAPIKRWVAAFSLAHSKEEKTLPYFSLGYRF